MSVVPRWLGADRETHLPPVVDPRPDRRPYLLVVPDGLHADPRPTVLGNVKTWMHTGVESGYWIMVSVLGEADAGSSLRTWVEACLGVLGFPVAVAPPVPSLLQFDWQDDAVATSVSQHLRVDECAPWRATAMDGDARVGVFGVVARRGARAWNVTLCLPVGHGVGSADEVDEASLENVAATVFGTLVLL